MGVGSTRREPGEVRVHVDGRELSLSNLDKVLYPAAGFTKAQVVDYYARVGPWMLPHLAGRVVTMSRYPDGVDGPSFFEKRCPGHRPAWVATARVGDGEGYEGCLVADLPSLVWAANLAALELHTPQARADEPDRPTSVVFDLDPGPPAGVLECCRVALDLRALLEAVGLIAVVKTSGGKGLHVTVPLHTRTTAEETKAFARAAGQLLARREPDRVTVTMRRDARPGKVFVDWSQNDRHKTTVCAYSLRAGSRPAVSTPVSWDEVAGALRDGDPGVLVFEAPEVLERVGRLGDLAADALDEEQELPDLA